jgi:hypothetical protein
MFDTVCGGLRVPPQPPAHRVRPASAPCPAWIDALAETLAFSDRQNRCKYRMHRSANVRYRASLTTI